MSRFIVALLFSCATTRSTTPPPATAPAAETPPADAPTALTAILEGTAAHPEITGTVTLVPTGDDVEVSFSVTGLPPGVYASHVHLEGDCSDPEGDSAGGHLEFAAIPGRTLLEPPEPAPAVRGNLGELTAEDDGRAESSRRVVGLEASQLPGLEGRGIIVHAEGNDPSDPSGNAGTPIACGVIAEAGQTDDEPEPMAPAP